MKKNNYTEKIILQIKYIYGKTWVKKLNKASDPYIKKAKKLNDENNKRKELTVW